MGSAIQPQRHTVQGVLEKIFQKLNITEKSIFSGRTDKDVHASAQVLTIKTPPFWNNPDKLKNALIKMVPKEISIKKVQMVANDFHARFSAKKREYRYLISQKSLDCFSSNYFHYEANLDIDKLKYASQYFLGEHDFQSFSKMGSDPNTTIRTIYKIDVYTHHDIIIIRFQGNAYLRSQIRMMVDFLLKIAKGKLTIDDLQKQLANQSIYSTTLAPASGLYLSKIIY